jgi:tetratricopeptide (TPR) repeat protein
MAALVFALVLAIYWPALHGGLVWDDSAHVTRPALRSLAGVGRIWFDLRATQQYYPVLFSTFWIEHRLWGDATLGYHLANVLWHATACCLLALLLRRLWEIRQAGVEAGRHDRRLPAGVEWLAALIFAAHPVGVESVAWISEQKNTLSLVFYLLSALAYLNFDERRRPASYGWALTLFILALGTKTVTATLPAALLLVFWWRRGGLSWRRDVIPLVPWFVIAVVSGLFTAWVERKLIGAQGAGFDLSDGQRLLLAGRVVGFYLGKLFWPAGLIFIYPHWDVPAASPGWYPWLGGEAAVTAALWLIRRRSRGPLAGWLFFIGSLAPALGFFNVYPFLFSYVADHFQYLASLGIIVTVATGMGLLLAGASPPIRTGGWAVCGLLVAGLAFLSHRQSRMYRDGDTLYRVTLARNPDCWMAHNNLAVELAESPSGVPEALAHYREALRLRPDYADAHNNLANLLATLPGRGSEAMAHYERALRLRPDLVEAHVNLASLLAKLPGRMPEALAHYREALRLEPDSSEIEYRYANLLAGIPGREPEATAHYERALRLTPDLAKAHVNLANLLAKLPGRMPEALGHYEEALRIDPGFAEAHYDLAVQLSTMPGRAADAISHYEAAVRIEPGNAEAHNNLAVAYAKEGRLEEAGKHWEMALALDPNYRDARRNLGILRRLKQRTQPPGQ